MYNKSQKENFFNNITIISNFYGLQKIHKPKQIKNAIETQKCEYMVTPSTSDLKFRFSVAGLLCPSNRLGKYFTTTSTKQNHYHNHHVALVGRISLNLSRHSSLSFIALGRSSGQHPVSSHSC